MTKMGRAYDLPIKINANTTMDSIAERYKLSFTGIKPNIKFLRVRFSNWQHLASSM